jgi:5-deoxy-glucuronate isomerase
MPQLIKKQICGNDTLIVPPEKTPTDLCSFRILRPEQGKLIEFSEPGHEIALVVLSGQADIVVGTESFPGVGERDDIWSGRADSVYAGTGSMIKVTASKPGTEVAVAGAKCEESFPAFRVTPSEVECVDVGSVETHTRRRIFHILGHNASGRCSRLLVSELYADPGCWSGYPPHKHDTERPPEETDFQEIYHYRFRPESGFGAQYCYQSGDDPQVVMTRHGDTFLVDRGYHPTVTSPGHEGYIFTILVGKHQRSLVQFFEPSHTHLMAGIPGLQAMRDKFK